MLVKAGMRTVQMIGVPQGSIPGDIDAVVIALSRAPTGRQPSPNRSPPRLAAAGRLPAVYFKYCSTFDSTPRGNIGPVAEALMQRWARPSPSPARPSRNGRTVYKGHLFVGDALLSDSGMRHHPLTPMIDANLVRVLQQQVKGKVGLVEAATLLRTAGDPCPLRVLRQEGWNFRWSMRCPTTTSCDRAACADMPLVTPVPASPWPAANFRDAGLLADTECRGAARPAACARSSR